MNSQFRSRSPLTALQARFGLGDMQIIVGGAMGHNLKVEHLEDVLQLELENKNSYLREAMRILGVRVSSKRLMSKIASLSPAELVTLQQHVDKLLSEVGTTELMFGGYLPDPSVLRLWGLVAPTTRVASALCIFLSHDPDPATGRPHYLEFPLYENIEGIFEMACSTEEESETLAHIIDFFGQQKRATENDLKYLTDLCYRLVAKTGLRYLRVEVQGDEASIVPITARELRQDIADGSIKDLALAGVNAPFPAITMQPI